jgi:hypothetical protein
MLPKEVAEGIKQNKAKPWCRLSTGERERLCEWGYLRRAVIDIFVWNPPDSRAAESSIPTTVLPGDYIMRIDWEGASIPEIIQRFENWVAGESKHHKVAESKRKAGGKRSHTPWDWLKQLAAWRLNSAGLNHGSAKKLVDKVKGGAEEDVLPNYSESGARFKAVEYADKRIHEGVSIIKIVQRWPKGEAFLQPYRAARQIPIRIDSFS